MTYSTISVRVDDSFYQDNLKLIESNDTDKILELKTYLLSQHRMMYKNLLLEKIKEKGL